MDYRDCEYAIRGRGRNKWQWSAYDGIGPGAREIANGEIKGARSKAVDDAKAAIDSWHDRHKEE